MKKATLILTAGLMLLSRTIFAHGEKTITKAAQESFKKEYGASVNAQWQEIRGVYVAHFLSNGSRQAAYYDAGGKKLGTGRYLDAAAINPTAATALHLQFPNGQIREVLLFSGNDSLDKYFVKLENGQYSLIVELDELGEIEIMKKDKN